MSFLVWSLLLLFSHEGNAKTIPPPARFTWANIESGINEKFKTGKPVQTTADLIALLPHEMRSNFTFMRKSGSPEGAAKALDGSPLIDSLHPRLILFSADAKLILAATTHPQSGRLKLEGIEFSDEASSFEMKNLEVVNGLPIRKSVASCSACHGQDARPIWEAYPTWPGAYGEVHDSILSGTKEYRDFQKFIRVRGEEPLLKSLIWNSTSKSAPYFDKDIFKEGKGFDVANAPNTRFGMALSELNRKRLYRQMSLSPLYAKKKYQSASVLLGCKQSLLTYNWTEAAHASIVSENNQKEQRCLNDAEVCRDTLSTHEEQIAQMAYVFLNLRIDRKEWSLSQTPYSVSFYDGNNFSSSFLLSRNLLLPILDDISHEDPEFQLRFKYKMRPVSLSTYAFGDVEVRDFFEMTEPMCDYLASKHPHSPLRSFPLSDAHLIESKSSSLPTSIQVSRKTDEKYAQIVKECASCHSSADYYAPLIPFNDLGKIRQFYQKSPSKWADFKIRIQGGSDSLPAMPLGGKILGPTEQEYLIQSIEKREND